MIDSFKNFKILRDDLYPFLGGGNKGRKIEFIEKDILSKKSNAVVTTGGVQSNHCRALALLAAKNKWNCTLVIHGDKSQFYKEKGNAYLMRLSGAKLIFVEETQISSAMDAAMDTYKLKGMNPYYLYGGGHTLEGGLAYIEAVKEIKKYIDNTNWTPDYIFLASGTGSTQAGILAGLDKYSINSDVIGISVGRKQKRAEEVVSSFYHQLLEHYLIKPIQDRFITVTDNYLCGGYGKYNQQIEDLSLNAVKRYGFTLDTTYTAKAFWGMMKEIEKRQLQNKNILFWHTGGVLNFLA